MRRTETPPHSRTSRPFYTATGLGGREGIGRYRAEEGLGLVKSLASLAAEGGGACTYVRTGSKKRNLKQVCCVSYEFFSFILLFKCRFVRMFLVKGSNQKSALQLYCQYVRTYRRFHFALILSC